MHSKAARTSSESGAADQTRIQILQPRPALDPMQRYGIEEACAYLRCSRGRLYEKVAAGEIRLIKDGRRSYVPGSEIAAQSRIVQLEDK